MSAISQFDEEQDNENPIEDQILEDAPPESQWYHGRLDRSTAETRLKESNFSNCYLIRETDSKPGAYVLSFKGKTGINHFRITALCGEFYIGGRHFHSLSHMIGYYKRCDLLKQEQLQNPVPPPEPVNDKKKVISVLSHTALPDSDELSFGPGEVFIITNDMGEDLMWATSLSDERSGIIHRHFFQEWNNDESIDMCEWYHPSISIEDTTKSLSEAGRGSWLVRRSETTKGNFTLYVYCEGSAVNKFKIEYTPDHQFFIGGRHFNSMDDIIQRYKKEDIVSGVKLGKPVTRIESASKDNYKMQPYHRPASGADIYFTGNNIVKGFLFKKGQKSKKWKYLYFILNQTDQLLYYFENQKRTKPKNLIELSLCVLFPVHDSLFSRSNVFQLNLRGLNQAYSYFYYLSANSQEQAQEWINNLKPLCCNPSIAISRPVGGQRGVGVVQLRSLQLKIFDAKSLRAVTQPYCEVSLDKVKVARTHLKDDNEPCWDDDFPIEDFPAEVDSLIITIFAREYIRKNIEICHVKISIDKLDVGKTEEQWFPVVMARNNCDKPSPLLRLRIRYSKTIILPVTEYQALKELILTKSLDSIMFLYDMCTTAEERTDLLTAFFNIHLQEGLELQLIVALLEHYIDLADCSKLLFRDNSVYSSLMDLYMQAIGNTYLQEFIRPIIDRIIENKVYYESIWNKIDNENLIQLLNESFVSIAQQPSKLPIQLRYIFTCLKQKVKCKWPNDDTLKTTVVSCFIFLRFICLSFTNPRKYNLIGDIAPSLSVLQIFKYIGTALNKLANLCEFKDSNLEYINPFLIENKSKIIQFIEAISNESDCPSGAGSQGIDLPRNFDSIYQLCTLHIGELQEKKNNCALVPRLLAVVNTITSHKTHYINNCQL